MGLFFSEGSFSNFSNSLIILERSFLLTFLMEYLAFLYFCGLNLALKPREVINPFPDHSNSPFDSEDVIFILSILSNFNEMSKLIYLSLPLISLCFLTVLRPQFFMFTARGGNSLPVNFSTNLHNRSEVSNRY